MFIYLDFEFEILKCKQKELFNVSFYFVGRMHLLAREMQSP